MKSPFPGMDPYIEEGDLWPDFHDDLIVEIKRTLGKVLPAHYVARTNQRNYIVLAGVNHKEAKAFLPDVGVFLPDTHERTKGTAGDVAVAEPVTDADEVTMRAFIDERIRENFIEIYESKPEVRLVTCIEVLSPSNKRDETEGWYTYLRKRNSLLLGEANFVEIDLLRGGTRMPMVEPWPSSPYYLLVARKDNAPSCRVHKAFYSKPLPNLVVPLRYPDPDVVLQLQPMIDGIYEHSRYGPELDYSKPLSPPFSADEAAWLADRLKNR